MLLNEKPGGVVGRFGASVSGGLFLICSCSISESDLHSIPPVACMVTTGSVVARCNGRRCDFDGAAGDSPNSEGPAPVPLFCPGRCCMVGYDCLWKACARDGSCDGAVCALAKLFAECEPSRKDDVKLGEKVG